MQIVIKIQTKSAIINLVKQKKKIKKIDNKQNNCIWMVKTY